MEVRPSPTWGLLRAGPRSPPSTRGQRDHRGGGEGPSALGRMGGTGRRRAWKKDPEPRCPPPLGRLPTAFGGGLAWQARPRAHCPQQSGSGRQWFSTGTLGPGPREGRAGRGRKAEDPPPAQGAPGLRKGQPPRKSREPPRAGGPTHLLLLLPVSPFLSPSLSVCAECVSPTRKRGWAGGGALRQPGTASSPLLRQWRL